MPRYVSCTGKDVILSFKGTQITIPANGYYETSAGDLSDLFPSHVRKIALPEIIKKIEDRLLPPKTIPVQINKPVEIIKPIIREVEPPKIEKTVLNTPKELTLPPIREVVLKDEVHEKITKTINNIMTTTNDPDLNEFLIMIRDILSS